MSVPAYIHVNHQSELINQLIFDASTVVLGKESELRLALCCVIAQGHLLIEDLPGMGKTTFVKILAASLGLKFGRIQFTNDILPGDITGSSIYRQETHTFDFQHGPIFAQLVLGDELNRASPRTQSACLEAMEEKQVTVDGQTHLLPQPFIFIATQNPEHSVGTFPLPDSQLDRFLMHMKIGLPSRNAEKQLLLTETDPSVRTANLRSSVTVADLISWQKDAHSVRLSNPVLEYLLDLATVARKTMCGYSPRANLALSRAAKAWAFIHGRDFVIPEDIKAVAVAVLSHRLSTPDSKNGVDLTQNLLQLVPVR